MLLPLHRQHLQEFITALEQLLPTSQQAENLELLREQFQEVQQIFQGQILTLSRDGSLTYQPYLTEIHRLLRLLQIDVMFLLSSQQAVTSQQRQRGIEERIKAARALCEVLLQKH